MTIKRIIGIGAADPHGVMGRGGGLPWHSEEDLHHFSTTIADHPIIMGYRTFLSLPTRHFLNRIAIIFSRQRRQTKPNQIFVSSLEEFYSLIHSIGQKELYLIGGAQLFELFLKEQLLSEFLLTEFKDCYEGDTFFPLARLAHWSSVTIKETAAFRINYYRRLEYENRCL
jgi:dihydrofolate reductase